MRKGIIALYDVTGIQNYVYGSNKLKYNIGASNLVEKCFDVFLINAIRKFYKEENFKTNWNKNTEWKYENDENLRGEIIYIGGGNALVVFKDTNIWKKINYEFSKLLMIQAPGLKFVTEYKELSSNFSVDIKEVFKSIGLKKYSYNSPNSTKGLCITKECAITKNPAVINYKEDKKDKGEILSYEMYMKRKNAENSKEEINIIDDLAGEKGNSYIGVVHIDGNNMGKNVENILSKCNEYIEAVRTIRDFSIFIQESYEKAYENMKKAFEYVIYEEKERESEVYKYIIKEYEDSFNEKNHSDLMKKYRGLFPEKVPLRKILIKGDDVTYVCYGKLAIHSIEIFFKELNRIFQKNEMTKNLNACAGIAFVKPHHPFSSAYEISEECCSSAKTKAKALNGNESGFYLDFHILRGGMVENLNETRNKLYKVFYVHNKNEKDFEFYNLLWRPFQILGDKDKKYDFKSIKKLINDLKNIPRSKIKGLRESFLYGEEEIKTNIAMMERRGYSLSFKDKKDIFSDEQTPYFDVIDFMELYDDLFFLEEEKQ